MTNFVLKLIALMVAWLIIQSWYDLRVKNQCADQQTITKQVTIYGNGVCYATDPATGKFRRVQ